MWDPCRLEQLAQCGWSWRGTRKATGSPFVLVAMEQPAVTASLNASHSLVLCDLPGDCTQRKDRNKDPQGSPLTVFPLYFPVTATPFLGCMLHSVAIGVLSHIPSCFCPSAVLGGRGRQGSLLGEGGHAWLSHLPTPTPSYRGARPRLLLSWTFVPLASSLFHALVHFWSTSGAASSQ